MNSPKILWNFIVSCLAVWLSVILAFGDESIDQEYLVKESFDLPTTGQASRTTKPLDPAQVYTIKIYSRYNLRPLKQVSLKKIRPEGEVFKTNILSEIKEFDDEKNDYNAKLQKLFSKRQELLTPIEPENHNYDEAKKHELESVERELENLKESQKQFEKKKNKFELKKQSFEKIKKQNPGWQLNYGIAPGPNDFPELFDYQLAASAILFNENPLIVKSAHPDDKNEQKEYLDTLVFSLRGQGRPLALRLVADFSSLIGFLKVEVFSPAAAKVALWQVMKAALWLVGIGAGIGVIFLSLTWPTWNKKRQLAEERKMLARFGIRPFRRTLLSAEINFWRQGQVL